MNKIHTCLSDSQEPQEQTGMVARVTRHLRSGFASPRLIWLTVLLNVRFAKTEADAALNMPLFKIFRKYMVADYCTASSY